MTEKIAVLQEISRGVLNETTIVNAITFRNIQAESDPESIVPYFLMG